MKKFVFALIAGALILISGCCCSKGKCAEREAIEMIRGNRAECVIVRDNRIVVVERGSGVSPLLKIYDNHRKDMNGSVVVDKVIGRAAAFIVIAGNSKSVYGKIMSEDALELLKKHNINATYDLLVPKILNRKRNGLCPLEDSVKNDTVPEKALESMRKRISELRKR